MLALFWIGSTGLYLRGTIRLQEIDYNEEYGEGVVDNWSGASLLPSLFESLESQALQRTFRFIGLAEEETGSSGPP